MKDLFLEIGGRPCIVTVADGEGQAMIRGRVWRWEYHRMLGPTFINKDGSDRKRIPGEKHPVWRAVSLWAKKNIKR